MYCMCYEYLLLSCVDNSTVKEGEWKEGLLIVGFLRKWQFDPEVICTILHGLTG